MHALYHNSRVIRVAMTTLFVVDGLVTLVVTVIADLPLLAAARADYAPPTAIISTHGVPKDADPEPGYVVFQSSCVTALSTDIFVICW